MKKSNEVTVGRVALAPNSAPVYVDHVTIIEGKKSPAIAILLGIALVAALIVIGSQNDTLYPSVE